MNHINIYFFIKRSKGCNKWIVPIGNLRSTTKHAHTSKQQDKIYSMVQEIFLKINNLNATASKELQYESCIQPNILMIQNIKILRTLIDHGTNTSEKN